MAEFKLVKTPVCAATGVSVTSAFTVPAEFTHFAVYIPPSTGWCATTTCNVRIQGSTSIDGTYYDVGYSNNPATSTSGYALWEAPSSAAVSGGFVICEALQFVPFARLRFTNTATVVAGGWAIYARKFD